MIEEEDSLVITTHNVLSIVRPDRREYILEVNKGLRSELLFLQECKLTKGEVENWNNLFGSKATFIQDQQETSYDVGLVWLKTNSSVVDDISILFRNKYILIVEIKFKLSKKSMIIINFHAPNLASLRRATLENLEKFLRDHDITPSLFLGDFNMVEHIEDRNPPHRSHDAGLQCLRALMSQWNLTDVARKLDIKDHTFKHSTYGSTSRIDRVYCRDDLFEFCQKFNVIPVSSDEFKFDHKLIRLEIKNESITDINQTSSRAPWRFNPATLKQPSTWKEDIRKELTDRLKRRLGNDPRTEWDETHSWITSRLKQVTRRNSLKLLSRLELLFKQRKRWATIDSDMQQTRWSQDHIRLSMERIESEIETLISQTSKKVINQRKLNWLHKGEKSTKMYFDKVRPDCKKERIHCLSYKGTTSVTPSGMCNIARDFYKDLYTTEGSDHTVRKEIIESLRRSKSTSFLTETDQEYVVKPISMDELRKAIRQMKNGKAPGPDGIPLEVYKMFPDLLIWLLPLYNGILDGTIVFTDHDLESTMILLFKKGDPTLMKNYRPISLLNVYYKIFSKILSNRLKLVLSHCIGEEQHAFLKNRLITDSVAELLLIDEVAKIHQLKDGVICFLDQEKAYDRVDHQYILDVLDVFGFPKNTTNLIKHLISSTRITIRVNQTRSDPFALERGLRQGDALSCYLYILAMEGLKAFLETDPSLEGISFDGLHTHFVKMYVDDTNVILKSVSMVRPLVLRLNRYRQGTQAKMNIEKSQVLPLGKTETSGSLPIPWVREGETVRNLGCPMGTTLNHNEFWDGLELSMLKVLKNLRTKYHSIRGKVICVNTFFASKIWYYAQFLPLTIERIER